MSKNVKYVNKNCDHAIVCNGECLQGKCQLFQFE